MTREQPHRGRMWAPRWTRARHGATQSITAVGASPDDAGLLELPVGSPLLHCERVTTDRAGRPALLSDAVFHPLATKFVAELPALDHVEPTGLRLIG